MKYSYNKKFKCITCEPNCAEECLQSIWEIGFDYDGYENDIKGLRYLVDELVELAVKGRDYIIDGKVTIEDVEGEQEASWIQAQRDAKEDRKNEV